MAVSAYIDANGMRSVQCRQHSEAVILGVLVRGGLLLNVLFIS